jgi:hypothetical protein
MVWSRGISGRTASITSSDLTQSIVLRLDRPRAICTMSATSRSLRQCRRVAEPEQLSRASDHASIWMPALALAAVDWYASGVLERGR